MDSSNLYLFSIPSKRNGLSTAITYAASVCKTVILGCSYCERGDLLGPPGSKLLRTAVHHNTFLEPIVQLK